MNNLPIKSHGVKTADNNKASDYHGRSTQDRTQKTPESESHAGAKMLLKVGDGRRVSSLDSVAKSSRSMVTQIVRWREYGQNDIYILLPFSPSR